MDWSIQQPNNNALAGFRQNLSKRLTIAAAKASETATRLAKEDLRRDMRAQRLGGLALGNMFNLTSGKLEHQNELLRLKPVDPSATWSRLVTRQRRTLRAFCGAPDDAVRLEARAAWLQAHREFMDSPAADEAELRSHGVIGADPESLGWLLLAKW